MSKPTPLDYGLTCARKVVFESRKKAKDGASASRKLHQHVLEPYKCPHCGWWHLTKWTRREKGAKP